MLTRTHKTVNTSKFFVLVLTNELLIIQQIHFMMTTIKNGAATSLAYQGGTSGPGGESNGQPTLSRPLSCDDAHHRADGKTTGKDNQL